MDRPVFASAKAARINRLVMVYSLLPARCERLRHELDPRMGQSLAGRLWHGPEHGKEGACCRRRSATRNRRRHQIWPVGSYADAAFAL